MSGDGADCVDLRGLHPARRYRLRLSGDHAPGSPVDPWDVELLCERGRIWAHGGSKLQAYTDRPRIGAALARLACVRVHQQGDHELTVIFDAADFDAVAAILHPIRRRPGRVGGPARSVFPVAAYGHLTALGGPIPTAPLEGVG